MFAGHEIPSAPAATTVTVNVQLCWLPLASAAVAVTVVVPTGNSEPEAGLQSTGAAPQLSVAVGQANVTICPPGGAPVTVMFAGQTSSGFSVSFTVTVKEQVAVLPVLSVAVAVTVV